MTKTTFGLVATLLLASFIAPPSVYLTPNGVPEKTIVLKSLDEVPLIPPKEGQNQTVDLSRHQKSMENWSQVQKNQANHWGANHIIRWNECIRELVAAHNVPPRCFADSSGYPTPKRDKAADLPRYPFANPPYAARVFAYTSVAQHDALLAAHFYQEKYGKNYPPNEAVIAAVTAEMLRFFFPAETEIIEQKADYALKSALLTGKLTPSDIATATIFGKAIAQKVIFLAQNDGMDAAQGTAEQWQQILKRRASTGETTWQSIQKPVRAPIEPFFGSVKPWWGRDVMQFRPAAPPSVQSEELKQDIELVKKYSRVSTKDNMAIVIRWSDPEFSYTPVGHWNLIACEMFLKNKTDENTQVRTLALMNRAMMDAAIVCWEAKSFYCYPRPSQVDKDIHPRLPLPNFPSYPSGHSTFSGAASTILSHFYPKDAQKLSEMAEEASMSRVYAALHFKMDCEAGMLIGKKVGDLAVASLGNR
jgi:PAP2 superfamily